MCDEAAPAETVCAGEHDRVMQYFEAYGALIILQQLLARRSSLLLHACDQNRSANSAHPTIHFST